MKNKIYKCLSAALLAVLLALAAYVLFASKTVGVSVMAGCIVVLVVVYAVVEWGDIMVTEGMRWWCVGVASRGWRICYRWFMFGHKVSYSPYLMYNWTNGDILAAVLSKDEFFKALHNNIELGIHKDFMGMRHDARKTLISPLDGGFIWAQTTEGFDYWDIRDKSYFSSLHDFHRRYHNKKGKTS